MPRSDRSKTIDVDALPDLVDTIKASEVTGKSRATLAYWRREGTHLPFIKTGAGRCGRVYYRMVDLEEFVAKAKKGVFHDVNGGKEGDHD